MHPAADEVLRGNPRWILRGGFLCIALCDGKRSSVLWNRRLLIMFSPNGARAEVAG